MRKTLSTIVLALGLVFAVAPSIAVADAGPAPCVGAGCPLPPCVGAGCPIPPPPVCYDDNGTPLTTVIAQQSEKIAAQRHTIRHQRAVIKRLRYRLSH